MPNRPAERTGCGASRAARFASFPLPALLLALAVALASACAAPRTVAPPQPFDHLYSGWASVLARCAEPSGFRYERLAADRSALDRQAAELSAVSRAAFEGFSREQRIAFLINAHNVFATRAALDARTGAASPAGRALRAALPGGGEAELFGARRSLADIRDELVGSGYHESRALFCLNWGVHGCPPLPPYPVTAANLENTLEWRTGEFLRDPLYNRYDYSNRRFYASDLLRRHRRALERDFTTLWNFVERYATETDRARMKERRPRFVFLDFDASPNDALAAAPDPSASPVADPPADPAPAPADDAPPAAEPAE